METSPRIKGLIDQLFVEKEDASNKNHDLAFEVFQGKEPDIVGQVLSELLSRKERGELVRDGYLDSLRGAPIYSLICKVAGYAEPGHAELLVKILFLDEIALDPDSSTRDEILETLKGIGDSSIVSSLEKFAQKLEKWDYSALVKKHRMIDHMSVKAAIMACKQREVVH